MSKVIALVTTELIEMQCGTCGVWHSLPKLMHDKCVEEGGFWHCPNGHQRGYDKGTLWAKNQELTKALESERKRKEWAEQNARNELSLREAAERKTAKLQKRVRNGVCPCCTRSFTNLRRHMATKHPEAVVPK